MPRKAVKQSDLGYLGEDFQYQIVKYFIEQPSFFLSIANIVDQNMFTDEHLRRIVGFMKDRHSELGICPNYNDIGVYMRASITDNITREIVLEKIQRLKTIRFDDINLMVDIAEKFFKQQNLAKAINKCTDILKRGDVHSYNSMETIIKTALQTNLQEDMGFHIFDQVEEDLRENYRCAIPTGAKLLDDSLYGGLGKGELGLIIAPSNTGKAQPLSSKVLTPYGFTTMGNIKVGDKVIGADGQAHDVLKTYPQGKRMVYTITFSDGSVVDCDVNHLWMVMPVQIVDGSVVVCDWKWKVLDFMEMRNEYLYINGKLCTNRVKYTYAVPKCEAVEMSAKGDVSVIEKWSETCGIDSASFPEQWLYWSVENRKTLLRKIYDCIGYTDHLGKCVYIKMNKRDFAERTRLLIKSLGGWCKISKSGTKNGQVFYKLECHDIPVLTKIELGGCTDNEKYVYIDSIVYKKEEETKCILLDSDDHLYITDDYIVTHNTSCTSGFAAYAATHKCEANNYEGFKVLHLFFEDEEVNIRRKYFGYVTDIDAYTLSEESVKPLALSILNDPNNESRAMIQRNIIAKRLPTGEVSASDIKYRLQQYISLGFKPDLIIIDYFECLKPERNVDGFMDSEWSREGVTMRKLETIANEFDVAIWVPIQGTKASIGQEHVGLMDGGGSVKKIQIGHVVITLAQTDQQKQEGRMSLFIGKLRAAKIGRMKFPNVKFNNGTCKFDMSDLDSIDNEIFS